MDVGKQDGGSADVERVLAETRAALRLAELRIDRVTEELRGADEALYGARAEKEHLSRMLAAVEGSSWWRMGAPFREAGKRYPGLARTVRGGLKLCRWVVTGQLLARLRARRAYLSLVHTDMRAALGLPDSIAPQAASDIALPSYGQAPVVSIIIPTYGQVPYTLRCLASIAGAPPRVPVEVIAVDDASGDGAVASLNDVQGLSLTVRDRNLGFLRSCNDIAKHAKGTYLLFLNNDTEVLPGAIDALVKLLEARPDAGMAGAKLLYPDGFLQEAGGIIWRDGSAWNYGNRDDPRRPEYSYVREADYISGAAIMLRRSVWESIGGFDEHFAPAYCEDSDLAFRLRQAGLKVLFQPAAQIIHHEGVSHGTDITSGVKAHQVINQAKLAARWERTIQRTHLPNGTRIMRARDRSVGRTVTLFVDHNVPEPNRDAGSRTIVAFIQALLASGRVVKFFPVNGHRPSGYTDALQQLGVEVLYEPYSKRFADWIAGFGSEIDEVLLSRPDVADAVIGPLRAACRAPVVYYGHDLHHLRLRRDPATLRDAAKAVAANTMEATEQRIWRSVDAVLYPSEEEAAVVRESAPGVASLAVQPYALPAPPPPHDPPPASAGLVFVAGFAHPPNVDAALWMVREILPRILAARPGIPLALVGSNPTQEVQALAGEGIEVTGFVTDEALARRYAEARVAVCPLRFGAGVKMKVVEAMHYGVPLVTTPAGAQGLDGIETICGVHGDADGFAADVIRLLDDDALWRARASGQSGFVAGRFSAEAMRAGLEAAFAAARKAKAR